MTMVDDVLKTIRVSLLPESRGPKPSKELVASIRSYGLMSPIVIRRDPVTEDYVIVDGFRRLAAVREIGLERVNVLLLNEHSVREAAELTLTMNHARSENILAETEALDHLRHYSDEMIRDMTGISKAALSTRFSWKLLGPDVLEAYNDGRLSMTAASALARAPESVRETFRNIVINGGKFTAPEVHREIESRKPKLTDEQQRTKDIEILFADLAALDDEFARLYAEAERLGISKSIVTNTIREKLQPIENIRIVLPEEEGCSTTSDLDEVPF